MNGFNFFFFSIYFLVFHILKGYTLSCVNIEVFKKCVNEDFPNPNDICSNHNCKEIINNTVVCSEPIFEIYKAAITLFCTKDDDDNFCPYHEAIGKYTNFNDLKQNIENEEALKQGIKDSCNLQNCKTSFYDNVKSIINNSILINDKHYEDIATNKIYKELLSLCE